MKRILAAVLSVSLAAPGPAVAGSARTSLGVSIPTLGPVIPMSGLPAAGPVVAPSLPSVSLTVPGAAAQRALEAAALPARPLAPVFHQVSSARDARGQVAVAAQAARAEHAKPALDAAFEGSLAQRGSEPVAAPKAVRAPPRLGRARQIAVAAAAGVFVPLASIAANGPALLAMQGPTISAAPSNGSTGLGVFLGLIGAGFAVWLARYLYMRAKSPSQDDPNLFRGRPDTYDAEAAPAAATAASAGPAGKARDKGQVYFEDVAGQDEAKLELAEVVDFLKNPGAYKALNPRYKGPKGVLLFGPPGTGKTLIARAVANEADVPFVHAAGSDFINTYVGTGANNVRAKFEEVRKLMKQRNAPGSYGILFIDEIEAIGGARTGSGDRSEETRTINALLAEMDGFEKDNIIVIAATNMPESLDPALLRGGRFGTKVPVGKPDVVGREAILKVHTKEAKLAEDVSLLAVARQTPGLAGADLEQVVQDATKLAKRRGGTSIAQVDFMAAVDEFTTGKKRNLVMSKEDKRVVAYHESGHAIVSHLMPNADPVRKVTIVPHGLNALGFMQAMPEEEKVLYSRDWLVDRIAVALGGRVAEKMMTGKIYSGAQNDLEQATRLAKLMVMQFGMSETIGHVSYDMEGQRPAVGGPLSEETRRKIDAEVRAIVQDALARVETLLGENRAVLEQMAQELMEKETLQGADMDRIIRGEPPPAPPDSPVAGAL